MDLGNLKLTAIHAINLRVEPVVLLGGVLSTRRAIELIDFEMPREVESWEQCAAWITWSLDNGSGGVFSPSVPVPWLEQGRRNFHLLPWEVERAAYESRPRCRVHREWARVALKALAAHLAGANDKDQVTLEFDGEILKIRCGEALVATPASGAPWPNRFSLSKEALRPLPRRLAKEVVEFSVWDSTLTICGRRYEGVLESRPRANA